jgi:uncharacterized protein (TIGR00255 family)
MIKSMTGFAAAEKKAGDVTVAVDIRSYNGRHLDVVVRLASGYMALEEKIKGLIAARILRGRVEARIQIKDESDQATAVQVDMDRAQAVYAALKRLQTGLNLSGDIGLDHLLGAGGILRAAETIDDPAGVWPPLEDCLGRALNDLEAMRKKEGDFIANDLGIRLDGISSSIQAIKKDSSMLLQYYQQRLIERIGALTRDTVEIDSGRIAQEAAFLADRSDISEELVRAASHIEQFRHIMGSDEPGGRKLNFLLQELHREFNTMGSKIGQADVSHRIVEVKAELEKIREQIQNVE